MLRNVMHRDRLPYGRRAPHLIPLPTSYPQVGDNVGDPSTCRRFTLWLAHLTPVTAQDALIDLHTTGPPRRVLCRVQRRRIGEDTHFLWGVIFFLIRHSLRARYLIAF